MFLGQYQHTLDDKGRLMVPARYRDLLAAGAYITQGFDKCLMVMTEEHFNEVYAILSGLNMADQSARMLRRLILSNAYQVEVDRVGRILVPQMWIYALPGLSNLWMILIKATPLLFLLGVEDIVYWARELGGSKTSAYAYPHPDWRLWYFLALLVFYLVMTKLSEIVLGRLTRRLSHGQATMAGEEMRRAAA